MVVVAAAAAYVIVYVCDGVLWDLQSMKNEFRYKYIWNKKKNDKKM